MIFYFGNLAGVIRLSVKYGGKRPGITGRCVTEWTTKIRNAWNSSLWLNEFHVGIRVPYEGNRITDGCVTEDVAGSLRCGSPGITLWGCSSYCGGLLYSKRWRTSGDTWGVGDCRQAKTIKIRSVWKCMVRLYFTQWRTIGGRSIRGT